MLQFFKNLFKKKKPPLTEGSYIIDTTFKWFYIDPEWLEEEAKRRNEGLNRDEKNYLIDFTVDLPPSSQHSTASSQLHSRESEKE